MARDVRCTMAFDSIAGGRFCVRWACWCTARSQPKRSRAKLYTADARAFLLWALELRTCLSSKHSPIPTIVTSVNDMPETRL